MSGAEVSQADSMNTQYASNRQSATGNLSLLEGPGRNNNLLQNAGNVVAAGNGT
jgi:hypothetical protein